MEHLMFLLVTTDSHLFGIKVENIQEILPFANITPVPGSQNIFSGVTNFKGEIIVVVNLSKIFDLKEDAPNKLVVVKTTSDKIALLVKEVGRIYNIPKNKITPPQKKFEIGSVLIDNKVVSILDISKIIEGEGGKNG